MDPQQQEALAAMRRELEFWDREQARLIDAQAGGDAYADTVAGNIEGLQRALTYARAGA